MNPLHIAAIKGHVEIMEHLLEESHLLAMEGLPRKETVLHLCVKHGQLGALKVLIDRLGAELVDADDENGETILHMAVRSNQLETIQYLVDNKKIKRRTRNIRGHTPLQVLNESPRYTATRYSEVRKLLLKLLRPSLDKILPKWTNTMMVVVILIATMAFQNSINPPGGIWQEDTSSHKAGDAVIAHTHPHIYRYLVHANTVAFISSFLAILLITTEAPSVNICFWRMAVYAMAVSMMAITLSYAASTMVTAPNIKNKPIHLITIIFILACLVAFVLMFLFLHLLSHYFNWKAKIRSQEDLTTDPLYKRILYWIYQHFETRDV
ncbi:ankyrin repeat-containing protein ITN1-like isoform X1 [Salvia hispanica]|nr:ankyrin repeat-containing protein ITN1-like isoform X1 [Salvia hispanica]